MTEPEKQGELLNEFAGRPAPSDELVDRANNVVDMWNELETSPVFLWSQTANEVSRAKIEATNSRLVTAFHKARIAGRTALALTIEIPKGVKWVISNSELERRLTEEYGWAVLKPYPNPEFQKRPILKKSPLEYAKKLIELEQEQDEATALLA